MLSVCVSERVDKPPTLAKGRTVFIYDQHENILAVAVEAANGSVTVTTLGDPNFHRTLQMLGITKVPTLGKLPT